MRDQEFATIVVSRKKIRKYIFKLDWLFFGMSDHRVEGYAL